jgi:hypothetical protein
MAARVQFNRRRTARMLRRGAVAVTKSLNCVSRACGAAPLIALNDTTESPSSRRPMVEAMQRLNDWLRGGGPRDGGSYDNHSFSSEAAEAIGTPEQPPQGDRCRRRRRRCRGQQVVNTTPVHPPLFIAQGSSGGWASTPAGWGGAAGPSSGWSGLSCGRACG